MGKQLPIEALRQDRQKLGDNVTGTVLSVNKAQGSITIRVIGSLGVTLENVPLSTSIHITGISVGDQVVATNFGGLWACVGKLQRPVRTSTHEFENVDVNGILTLNPSLVTTGHTHAKLVASDGSPNPALSADASGNLTQADGLYIATDEIRAAGIAGLKLYEDGGKGIFVQDVTGNVGIGTTGPGYKLQVQGDAAFLSDKLKIQDYGGIRPGIFFKTGAGTYSTYPDIYRYQSDDTVLMYQQVSNAGLKLETTGGHIQLMGGKVGIGTVAPGNPLAVNRAADGVIVDFESADTVEGSVSISGTTTSYNAFLGSHYTQLKDGQKELPVGAVVVSTGEIIPCERNKDVETVKKVEVVVKDAIETIEVPAVEAVKEVTEAQYFVEDGKILSKEVVITKAQEAVSASTEKKLKENHVLDEKTGKIYWEDKTVTPVPQDVSNKEYFTYVDTTIKAGDKAVYGVWFSKLEDDSKEMSFGENGKPVYLIAQVGLFKIRVTDTNGDIAVGDFLETSTRAAEAQKQTTGAKVNSTIAKALTSVKWNKVKMDEELGYKWQLIPCIF